MQNKVLPNVSTIYRQLSHIVVPEAQHSQYINSKQSPYKNIFENNFSKQPQSSVEELYQYKKLRHEQLMQRLHQSYQQNRKIIFQFNPNQGSNYNQMQQNLNYNSSNNQFYETKKINQSSKSSYRPKSIKYRHIQDFQKKEFKQSTELFDTNKNKNQILLQRQFYEDQEQIKIQKKTKDFGTQYQPIISDKKGKQKDQIESMSSLGEIHHTWANKQSKYEEKLDSYYQLCKKIGKTQKLQMHKQQKFVRRETPNRTTGLQLDQAIKILAD